ncbi:MAG: YlmC/YmxH family sporulation protein [Clostridiales bacterium]|nr:YlmC/YmxH family sporulation protein [Clostridiales bacterium]
MLFSELKCKQVINLKDCKCLGRVIDLEFEECSGQICKIIVSNSNRICSWFNNEPEYVICFKEIKKIGPDIIIVDVGR